MQRPRMSDPLERASQMVARDVLYPTNEAVAFNRRKVIHGLSTQRILTLEVEHRRGRLR